MYVPRPFRNSSRFSLPAPAVTARVKGSSAPVAVRPQKARKTSFLTAPIVSGGQLTSAFGPVPVSRRVAGL